MLMSRTKFLAISCVITSASVLAANQWQAISFVQDRSVVFAMVNSVSEEKPSIEVLLQNLKSTSAQLERVREFDEKFRNAEDKDNFSYAKLGIEAGFIDGKDATVSKATNPFVAAMERSNALADEIIGVDKEIENLGTARENAAQKARLTRKKTGLQADKLTLDNTLVAALKNVDSNSGVTGPTDGRWAVDEYKAKNHSVEDWRENWLNACKAELSDEGIVKRVAAANDAIHPTKEYPGDDFAGWDKGFLVPVQKFARLVTDCNGLLRQLRTAYPALKDELKSALQPSDVIQQLHDYSIKAAKKLDTASAAKNLIDSMISVQTGFNPAESASNRHTRVKMAKLREFLGLAADYRVKVLDTMQDALLQIEVQSKDQPKGETGDQIAAVKALAETSNAILAAIRDVQRKYALASDEISGINDDWATRRIPLFYYPDPMGIVQSLRPSETPRLINPQSESAANSAKVANAKLKELEAGIFATGAKINAAKSRIVSIREEIATITRELDDANRESVKLGRDKEDLTKAKTKQVADRQKEVDRQGAVQTALETERAKIPDPADAAAVAKHQREIARLEADLALSNRRIESMDRKAEDQANLETALDRRIADNNAAVTTLDARKKELVDDQQQLPAQLKSAETSLLTLQGDIAKARAERTNTAQIDADAFGEFATTEPMYVLEADQGRADAAGRVQMIVYPRSKMLMLRGPVADVLKVHQWVSIFDRPAPQAKISIHSLQINGSNPVKINEAVQKASQAIRLAKSRVQIVQDTLRNALNQEVANCAAAAKGVYGGHSKPLSDRFYRTYFFHPEVRQQLGMVTPDPRVGDITQHRAWDDQRAIQDLDGLASNLAHAMSLKDSVNDYKEMQLEESRALANMHINGSAADLRGNASHDQKDHSKRQDEFTRAKRAAAFELRQSLTNVGYYLAQFYGHVAHSQQSLGAFGLNLTNLQKASSLALKFVRKKNDDPCEIDKFLTEVKQCVNDCDVFTPLKLIRENLSKSAANHNFSEPKLNFDAQVSAAVLPDPSRATTLGEMIFMISLASEESRRNILEAFSNQLYTESLIGHYLKGGQVVENDSLANLAAAIYSQFGVPARTGELFTQTNDTHITPLFPRSVFGANGNALRIKNSMVGTNGYPVDDTDATTSNQLEILYALKSRVRNALLMSLEGADDSIDESAEAVQTFSKAAMYLSGQWTPNQYASEVLSPTRFSYKVPITKLAANAGASAPRTAAADQMLKRFIESFETDFDAYFMDDMLTSLRKSATGSGIEFGSYERRSILASNRLLTRQEVTATGSSIMDPDRDLRAEAATLFGLIDSVGNKKSSGGKSGSEIASESLVGAAGAAYAARQAVSGDPTKLTQFGLFGALLGGLLGLPNEPQGDVYSIGSGGTFKVVPIFDPTGQGVRFRFDYVQGVQIQEPDKTTRPDPSRVERHTTNTEVAVTNMDLQEISSFESNMRLGTPLKKTGGIPILREFLPDVPIVGYFVKRGGAKPLRQHTLIFAQTVMYPSIADLGELMLDTPIFPASTSGNASSGRAVYASTPGQMAITTTMIPVSADLTRRDFISKELGGGSFTKTEHSTRYELSPQTRKQTASIKKPTQTKKHKAKKKKTVNHKRK